MEELEGRVTALESQMRIVRQDSAAARVLAGGADRDVAALTARMDAQTRLMQALRETQVEDSQRLDVLETKFDRLEEKVDRGFGMLAVGQAQILALLNRTEPGEEGSSAAE